MTALSAQLVPLTVHQYHAMLENGILRDGDPYELLDGVIVRKDRSAAGEDPMTIGHEHAWVVKKLAVVGAKLRALGCHMQTQQPILVPPHAEPEPDGAVVIGSEDDYRHRHPSAKDVLCVIEVADASLEWDRTVKLRVYARAGIPCYMIINLIGRSAEVFSRPLKTAGGYDQVSNVVGARRIAFPAAGGRQLLVPLRQLLPWCARPELDAVSQLARTSQPPTVRF